MLPLILGSVLAVAGLAYVLWPIWRSAESSSHDAAPLAPLSAPEASAIEALREIEFDQATGKLSPEDYASLRASYTPLALAELRAKDVADAASASASTVAASTSAVDAAELLIARAKKVTAGGKVCAEHGPRPEADAIFCSDCGRFLGGACLKCGARVDEQRARFCTECGASLAA